MDPLSITSSVQTVLLLATHAYQLISAIHGQLSGEPKEPLDARSKVLAFELDSAVNCLIEWQRLWTQIPPDMQSQAYFVLLWGQAGQREISRLLEDVRDLASRITSEAQRWQQLAQKGGSGIKARWLWRKTPGDNLNQSIERFVKRVNELVSSTDLHFRTMHSAGRKGELNLGCLAGIIQSREISTALYVSCRRSQVSFDLDLSLLDSDSDIDTFADIFDWSDLPLSYHLLVLEAAEDQGQIKHLRLEQAYAPDYGDQVDPVFTFSAASRGDDELQMSQLPPESSFDLTLPIDLDGSHPQLHCVCSTSKDLANQLPQPISFLSLSKDDVYETASNQSIEKGVKTALAYRLAESSLFLIGTPWLSHLSSQALRVAGEVSANSHYSLRISSSVATASGVNNDTYSLEQSQMYQIGVILIEIALETPWIQNGSVAGTLDAQTAKQIQDKMGVSYREACEDCLNIANGVMMELSDDSNSSTKNSETTLAAYYTQVFLRLREMRLDIL